MPRVPKRRAPRTTNAIRQILDRDPAQQILRQLELVQAKANFLVLRRITRKTRPHERGGWIHVSDAKLPCDRLLAGSLLGVEPPRRFITPQTRRIFDNGTYMHLRFQSYFLCLPKPFVVVAPKVLRKWPIIGEADVTLQHPEIGNWVIELKTMNTSQFRSLHAPFADHEEQLNGYQGLSGWGGQVWYENKNDQKLKLYTREFDRSDWQRAWTRASDVAGQVLAGRLPGMCPDCPDVAFCEDEICITDKALEGIDAQRRRWR